MERTVWSRGPNSSLAFPLKSPKTATPDTTIFARSCIFPLAAAPSSGGEPLLPLLHRDAVLFARCRVPVRFGAVRFTLLLRGRAAALASPVSPPGSLVAGAVSTAALDGCGLPAFCVGGLSALCICGFGSSPRFAPRSPVLALVACASAALCSGFGAFGEGFVEAFYCYFLGFVVGGVGGGAESLGALEGFNCFCVGWGGGGGGLVVGGFVTRGGGGGDFETEAQGSLTALFDFALEGGGGDVGCVVFGGGFFGCWFGI